MKQLAILLILLFGLYACDKPGEPDARICPGKDSYKTTDTIKMINCSLRSQKQRWVLPDGTQSTDNEVFYIPNGAGVYNFTIYVSDDDFVNEYATTLGVIVQ